MKLLQYICLACGHTSSIEYNEDGTFTKPRDCPQCQIEIPFDRVKNIIEEILHPSILEPLNPTQQQYTERDIHEQQKNVDNK